MARLLLGPKTRPGWQHLQAKGSTTVTHHLVAHVAAGVVVRSLFQEDRLDARFEIPIIKLWRLRVWARWGLRRKGRSKQPQQDGSRQHEPSRNYLWQNPRNHNHLTFARLYSLRGNSIVRHSEARCVPRNPTVSLHSHRERFLTSFGMTKK